jgi:hypothetical protein
MAKRLGRGLAENVMGWTAGGLGGIEWVEEGMGRRRRKDEVGRIRHIHPARLPFA